MCSQTLRKYGCRVGEHQHWYFEIILCMNGATQSRACDGPALQTGTGYVTTESRLQCPYCYQVRYVGWGMMATQLMVTATAQQQQQQQQQ